MTDLWNKCQVCGKLIAYKNFLEGGGAIHKLLTPDSYTTHEEWETLCKDHVSDGVN